MATIHKRVNRCGSEVWRVQFRKPNPATGEIDSMSVTCRTEKDAKEFIDKWEHVFYLKGKKHVKYDPILAMRKRRFHDKLKNNP